MAEHPLSDSISTEIVASKVFAGNFSSKRLFERSECIHELNNAILAMPAPLVIPPDIEP